MDKPRRQPPRSLDGFVTRKQPTLPSSNQTKISRPPTAKAASPVSASFNTIRTAPIPKKTETPKGWRAKRRAHKTAKGPQKRWKKVAFRSTIAVALVVFIGGGIFGWNLLRNVNKVFHGNIIGDAHALISNNTKLKGEDQGRVNILLAGDSSDDPGHDAGKLTDSIMVLSVDTNKHTAFMLSIPRDLYVNIPGWSHQKINAANEVDNFNKSGYPKGGMGQLQQIVQEQLGIPVHYYGLINYTAFRDSVNAVGGVTINIQSPDQRGLYDPNISKPEGGPLKLPNGTQTLNGQTALNLARARGDPTYDGRIAYGFPNSDFDRTEHQRQLLTALKSKASSAGVLSNPVKITKLVNTAGNNVKTDLKLNEILRFVQLTKDIDMTNIQSVGLTNAGTTPLLIGYTTPEGQSALIPRAGIDDFSEIKSYYQKLTADAAIVKEAPTVVVLNGTSVNGLARKEGNLLQSKGFTVASVGSSTAEYDTTMIIDRTTGNSKPASKKIIEQLLSTTATPIASANAAQAKESKGLTADYIIVLGKNSSNL